MQEIENKETGRNLQVYIKGLFIRDFGCFKGENEISFCSPDSDKPAQWTIIIGNNNTGKTTLLRVLTGIEKVETKNELGDGDIIYFPSFVSGEFATWFHNFNLAVTNPMIGVSMLIYNKITKTSNYYNLSYSNGGAIPNPSEIEYHNSVMKNLSIYGYGVNRKISTKGISDTNGSSNCETLFSNDAELINVEDWLLQIYLATKTGNQKAEKHLAKIKRILTSGVLPDVKDFEFVTDANPPFKTNVLFKTDFGKIKLNQLGYGYQASLAWIMDLTKKMFDEYSESEDPTSEAAIVLIDEIDLHLHPDWQRKIIKFLSNLFPNVQFIATAHSPMIIQSAENINLVLLEKKDDKVEITQPQIPSFIGWSIEEILDEIMGLGDKTYSDKYLELLKQFNDGVSEDNYQKTITAYNELDKILNPRSSQRKLLRLQMSSVTQN